MESLSIEGMGLDLGKLMKTFNSELQQIENLIYLKNFKQKEKRYFTTINDLTIRALYLS